MKKTILISILSIFFLNFGLAQVQHPKHRNKQIRRIQKGRKDGSLTKLETAHLLRQQRNIKVTKRRLKIDGRYTISDRRIIKRKKRRASRNIYNKKHNFRTKRNTTSKQR